MSEEVKIKDSGIYIIMWAILIVGLFLTLNINQIHLNIAKNTTVIEEQNLLLSSFSARWDYDRTKKAIDDCLVMTNPPFGIPCPKIY